MKKIRLVNLIIIMVVLLSSCETRIINNKLEFYGYSVGDTLTNDFEVIRNFGSYFSEAKFLKDTSMKVSTIGNHISTLYLLQEKTGFENSLKAIENILDKPKLHYIGDTIYGIKLDHRIEYFYWYDTTTYNKYTAYINIDLMRSGTVIVSNDTIDETLKKKFIDDYTNLDNEIEIVEFEN